MSSMYGSVSLKVPTGVKDSNYISNYSPADNMIYTTALLSKIFKILRQNRLRRQNSQSIQRIQTEKKESQSRMNRLKRQTRHKDRQKR